MAFPRRYARKTKTEPSNKLLNKKVEIDGITFDSKKEAKRYQELKLLEKAGKISDLELQKVYELIPSQYETYERYGKNGQRLKDGQRCIEKAVTYKADFVYKENGKTIVEDVKGYKDPASGAYSRYVIKRKLMLYVHGIKVIEV